MLQTDALISYFLHIDPDTLDDDTWVEKWAQVQYLSEMFKKK